MPRFGMKVMLFAFVLLALWFSTFAGYMAGRDVRASVLLVGVLAAGFTAVYSDGKRRAFWAGFFVVMLLFGGNIFQGPLIRYVPTFEWLRFDIQPNLYPAPSQVAAAMPIQQPVLPSPSNAVVPQWAPAAPATFTLINVAASQRAAAIDATMEAAWALSLATLVGFIAVLIRGQQPRSAQPANR